MKALQQRFNEHWSVRGFGKRPQKVLLALSGGLDSMVLAHLLLDAEIPFAAAHCNFSLRAEESDEDARFVNTWCLNHDIVCHQIVFDTSTIAAERGDSIQIAARELRYEWFHALLEEHRYAAILTAHHANDIAETLLINLCRGTGIAGLHGIPEKNGKVIRPLLFATRTEIATFADASGIRWREDASNAKTDYVRNSIRHEILPKLDVLFPGAAGRMAETAQRIGEAETIYQQALRKQLDQLMEQRGHDWYIPVKLLLKKQAINTLIYELLTPFDFSPGQMPQVLDLLHAESGKSVSSVGHRIIRNRDFLIITSKTTMQADLIQIDELPACIETETGRFDFSWEPAAAHPTDDTNIAWVNGDEVSLPLVLRTRREGDYFYPLGMGMKKKKLKRFLINLKIPIHEKDRVRILESDKRIVWIAGRRIDERFKVTPSSSRILKVVYTGSTIGKQ